MVVTVPAPAAAIIFAPIESWCFPSSYAHQSKHINTREATVIDQKMMKILSKLKK